MSDECFVFIQLPRSADVVPCARVRTEVRDRIASGQFAYLKEYLERADAVAIDPFELPLHKGIFRTTKLRGVFGAVRDASPDAWGRRLIEHSLNVGEMSEVQYLLNSPEDRAGALSFSRDRVPPAPLQAFNRTIHLAELIEIAHEVLAGIPAETVRQAHSLLQPGTSLGGARPKAVVEDDGALWVAKFPLEKDRWNTPVVEAAMLSLARRAGLHVADHRIQRVGDKSVLLVKRFDREASAGHWLRSRMVSGLTVLTADDSITDRHRWSYPLLAEQLGRWTSDPRRARLELFSRIAFNALISNTDDHPRNHALIAPAQDWHLSPAYDLTPSPSHSHERRLAMSIWKDSTAATRENLLSTAPTFELDEHEAREVIDRIKDTVSTRWELEVREHGGTDADVNAIASAFDYPGFEYAPTI